VQFASDAAALLILAVQEPGGKLAQALIGELDRGGLIPDLQILFLEFLGVPTVDYAHGDESARGHHISERAGKFTGGKGAPGMKGRCKEVIGCR
jgi:hypothetical protein